MRTSSTMHSLTCCSLQQTSTYSRFFDTSFPFFGASYVNYSYSSDRFWYPEHQPVPGDAAAEKARRTMFRIGSKLLVDSKAAIDQNGKMNKGSSKSKDLLSLLVRANTSTELADNQRMSDGDVLARAFISEQFTKKNHLITFFHDRGSHIFGCGPRNHKVNPHNLPFNLMWYNSILA